ncbi:MAG: hypothetical protein RIR48_489 [Bacteroidota bacterium]|jgi:hypothetical protein
MDVCQFYDKNVGINFRNMPFWRYEMFGMILDN